MSSTDSGTAPTTPTASVLQGMAPPQAGREHRRLALAVLLSLLAHALLASLTFGGEGVGLPGFSLPWRERRVEAPELRVLLGPAAAVRAEPASTLGEVPPSSSELAPRTGPAPTPSARVAPPREMSASVLPAARPDAEAADAKQDAELSAVPAQAPTRGSGAGRVAPAPVVKPANPDEALVDTPASSAQAPPAVSTPVMSSAQAEPPASTPVVTAAPATPNAEAVTATLADAGGAVQEEARRDASRREAERQEVERQALQQREAQRQEAARREAERAEAARKELERQDAARRQAERLAEESREAQRRDATRREAAQREAERQEAVRQEAARLESERVEAARREAERREAQHRDADRQAADRVAAEQREAQRREAERQEAARREATLQDAARLEAARRDAARQEAARQEVALQEAARVRAKQEEEERREARLRAIGRQLDEEAARREQASPNGRQSSNLPQSLSTARRARLWGRADPNAELVRYAEAWARKIQLNTPVDTVREIARRPHTQPMVTVAIRSDGSVESVTVVVSSGVADIDEAVRRIVQSHANYPAFPPELARDYDVVEIRRTWHFDTAVRLY